MSRAIDADTLSEWLKDYGQKVIKGERKISLMYVWKHIQDMPTIEERKTGKWISCSERLPERGEDVLVTRDYDGRKDHNKSCRYVEVASCYGDDDDILWSSYSDEYKMTPKNHHVIAWMPLPEPYRGEGE